MDETLANQAVGAIGLSLEAMMACVRTGDLLWQVKVFHEKNGGTKNLPHEWIAKGLSFLQQVYPDIDYTPEDVDLALRLADRWRKAEKIFERKRNARWMTTEVMSMLDMYLNSPAAKDRP